MSAASRPTGNVLLYAKGLVVAALLLALYWRTFRELYVGWTLADSYYLHGFLVPPVSAYFVWRQRRALQAQPLTPSAWGVPFIALACLMLVGSDFLGLRVFGQLSLLPMIAGLVLVFLGPKHLAMLWFPILFLLCMIPIPPSITQSLALRVKFLASGAAVSLARLCMLPVVQDGSYLCFPNDRLVVGEVCGGLRSLIALISFGALAGYLSRTRPWAQVLLFLISGPIAVAANTFRILFLCVVAYFWGSAAATGVVHDLSGALIFLVAFILLFSLEALLRRLAPAGAAPEEPK